METEESQKKERDEFDISSSDDGGLAKKLDFSKVPQKKKPVKKLTKISELFPSSSADSKKAPGPKKTAAATSKKHKKSETQSESERPVKKKARQLLESDSSEDFEPSPSPKPAPKTKRGLKSTL